MAFVSEMGFTFSVFLVEFFGDYLSVQISSFLLCANGKLLFVCFFGLITAELLKSQNYVDTHGLKIYTRKKQKKKIVEHPLL